VPLSCFRSG